MGGIQVRNFILIIRRFFNLILFAVLEIICFILIANSHTLQGDDMLNSADAVTGLAYKKQSDLFYYISLGKMNDSLLSENARLRKMIDQYRSIDTLKDMPVHRQLSTADTTTHIVKFADYRYRTARVINNSVNEVNNYITINRGLQDSITKGMSVLSGTGLVGKVEHVSAHFATILSIMSRRQPVSAKLKDGTFGSTTWDNEQPEMFTMKDMPQEAKIKKGDSVFTTSFSLFFPPDVLIGTVAKIEVNKKNGLQQLSLKPASNFRNLQYVYIVNNLMAAEKKQLEDSSAKSK